MPRRGLDMTETPPVKANKNRKLALMLACEFGDKHVDVITVASEFLAFLEPDQYSASAIFPTQTFSIPSRY